MRTIDNFLVKLIQDNSAIVDKTFSARDASVLKSLAQSVVGHLFITENQSRLLLKILKEQQHKLVEHDASITEMLDAPLWSRSFRKIEQVRKLYISNLNDNAKSLTIEFTFSATIRKFVTNLSKIVENLIQGNSGKLYYADLTEKNIVTLVDELSKHDFQIDEQLQEYYNTIKSWSKSEVCSQFLLTNITHTNFQKAITADLGIETAIDESIIADRSMRYQYFTENVKKTPQNLTEMLAFRENARVWVDSTKFSLDELVSSLIDLKRLPVMFVFDGFNPGGQYAELKKISEILEKNRIFDRVGFYFRLPNNAVGKDFNELISTKKYNCILDKDTLVVGVQSGKIPKFFLSNEWKPMSVVSINNTLRHSKTSVYANCCDLIIAYTDKNSIFEKKNIWQ